jgi:hypothetical protein
MPSEGGDVPQDGLIRKRQHDLARAAEGPDGHTAAHALGHEHDIGDHIIPLHGEQVAGTAEAGLNFIKDEQCARFVTTFSQFFQIITERRADAPLGLYRLYDDSGGFFQIFAASKIHSCIQCVGWPEAGDGRPA